MFTTSIPSNPSAAGGILADLDERPVPRHGDGGDLMHEVVQVKARQHALRLAEEAVRGVVSQSDAARSSAAWRDVHRTVERLQRAAGELASSPLFDARNAAGLPQDLVLNLRDVAPGTARVHAVRALHEVDGRRGTGRSARRRGGLPECPPQAAVPGRPHPGAGRAGRPARSAGRAARPLRQAGLVRPAARGHLAPPLRDDMRQLLASLKPVQGALASPRGAVQLLLAFARAAQNFPAEVADITRRHDTAPRAAPLR